MTKDPTKKERRLSVIAIFVGKDNHDESKCFKKMAALEVAMKKHHIILDLSSESTSHGHALCASGYSYTTSSSSTSIEWFIDSGAFYHMAKDKAIFYTMHECNTKQIFVGDDISLSVVGSRIVPVEMVISVMYYVFQKFPAICYHSIKLLIRVKIKLWRLHLTKL